ncbi:HutD family protein [Arthrobacter cheniae]|uniref:HutD family protein n=1 Tax=Arthrobacter cheniae TaxID=1258888 RepID=A0A3A5LYQ3_9MICC|nr:HutD family protein [Arthrobacter cheniae]RJT76246.1 HutD family protein [Arthrobacter cheniae]
MTRAVLRAVVRAQEQKDGYWLTRHDPSSRFRPSSRSIVSTGQVPATAWRNGAGNTREIAAFRSAGSTVDFAWRVSVADLARNAPFSRLPGVDRTLLIASGDGIVLDVAGTSTQLDERAILVFSGEDDAAVTLSHGPAVAVNLMTARSRCSGGMDVLPVEGARTLGPATAVVLVLEGSARTAGGEVLRSMDFLLCGLGTETLEFTAAVALFISIRGGDRAEPPPALNTSVR